MIWFADGKKFVAMVGLEEDKERLRQALIKWSEVWQILLTLIGCN